MKIITYVILITSIIILYTSNSYGKHIELSPQQEIQFKDLTTNLRCVVCNNQSIYESDSPIAQNIRKLIRNRIEQGQKSLVIKDYLHKRYGDVILLTPPFNKNTLAFWVIIWIILLLLISIILLVLFMSFRKSNNKIVTTQGNDKHAYILRSKTLSHKKSLFMLTFIIIGSIMLFTFLFIRLDAYNYYKSVNSFNININKIDNSTHLTKKFCENPSIELTTILMGRKSKLKTLINKCLKDYPHSTYVNNLKNVI